MALSGFENYQCCPKLGKFCFRTVVSGLVRVCFWEESDELFLQNLKT